MFVDEVSILVEAGKGGDGCMSFHREKFVPKGGPDGGNGGRGGDIIFRSAENVHTLYNFRSEKSFHAKNGTSGGRNNRTGKNGESSILVVPVGTQIRDKKSKRILADLVDAGQEVIIARGGDGGKGNAGFVNSVRQAPHFAEKGDRGEKFELDLELKLVADIALVGFPNAGKSTFISVVSNARPRIADYPFTTLVPHLGVASIDEREFVFIDVPGLIEGAHEGKGLGYKFLRHIERARFVLHLIDVNSNTPLKDFEVIRSELEKFSSELSQKPFLVVFTKIDLTDGELEDFLLEEFEKKFGIRPIKISSATHEGVQELLREISHLLPEEKKKSEEASFVEDKDAKELIEIENSEKSEEVVFRPAEKLKTSGVKIEKTRHWWAVYDSRLEQMVRQTDISNSEACERIYDVLKKRKIFQKLAKEGAQLGDKIRIGDQFWEMREV